MKIEWPDLKFPPVNLWIVSPAWWFYRNKSSIDISPTFEYDKELEDFHEE